MSFTIICNKCGEETNVKQSDDGLLNLLATNWNIKLRHSKMYNHTRLICVCGNEIEFD